MRKYIPLLFILPAITGCQVSQQALQKKYSALITEESAKKHLTILTSPEYAGRGTGQEGGKKAAEYVANEYAKAGLTKPVNGSFFQPLDLEKTSYSVDFLTIAGKNFTYGKDFYVQGDNTPKNFQDDQIVFLGYGIQDAKYNDVKNMDVAGKIVLLINEGEPKNNQGNSLITGDTSDSEWTSSRFKRLQELYKMGPKMILAASSQVPEVIKNYGPRMLQGSFALKNPNKPAAAENNTAPILYINPEIADAILATNGTSIEQVKKLISETSEPNSFSIATTLQAKMGSVTEDLHDPNIIGIMEGSDLKDEYVVIGGHYDHDGILPDGTYFPGADDNGSGTVTVIELAKAFAEAKKQGKGPRRNIIFMGFAAEEKGLLGSKFYVNNPIIPLEKTVACINIDMIGRIDDKHLNGNHNYIHVIGTNKLSSDLNPIVEKANNDFVKMELDTMYNDPKDPMRLYYRSDHYNFAKEGIPSVFFFSGLHPHYHTPEDTVDKIDFPILTRRAKLAFHVAWDLVNRDTKPAYDMPDDVGTR